LNEGEPIQIDAQQTQLAGGQQGNNPDKMSHNFISASIMSARIKFDICNCADLASLHADDEDHQPNVRGHCNIPDFRTTKNANFLKFFLQ
jgi:hypothetical protein